MNNNIGNNESSQAPKDVDDDTLRNKEEGDEEELVPEDHPQFRCTDVAVMSGTDPLSNPHSAFSDASRFDQISNFDTLGISEIDIKTRAVSLIQSLKQFTPDKSSRNCWKVNEKLSPVPLDYPLKRGYRKIKATSLLVAARISDCLRSRSIQVTYDEDKAQADCKAKSNVHFHIRLFAGETDGIVIVHVHRLCGCGFAFREDCFAILDAAEDIVVNRSQDRPFVPPTLENDPLDTKILEEAIENSSDHLNSQKRELQLFALEHVAAMTDSTKSSEFTANQVSKMIMQNPEGVRKSLVVLLTQGSLNGETSERYSDKENLLEMKNLGLTILSNVMSSLSKDGSLDHVLKGKEESRFFLNDLMPALFIDLKNYETCPHNASLAAKSLSILFKHSYSARRRCQNIEECLMTLESAIKYGARRHASLQEEASNALLNVTNTH